MKIPIDVLKRLQMEIQHLESELLSPCCKKRIYTKRRDIAPNVRDTIISTYDYCSGCGKEILPNNGSGQQLLWMWLAYNFLPALSFLLFLWTKKQIIS